MGGWFEAKIIKVEDGICTAIKERLSSSTFNPLKEIDNSTKEKVTPESSTSKSSEKVVHFPHKGTPEMLTYHIGFEKLVVF